MKKILCINSSPRGAQSESFRLSWAIINHLARRYPRAELVHRQLLAGNTHHIDSDYASELGAPEHRAQSPLRHGSISESEVLIRELEQADCLVIGTPMHNYTIPSVLKAWVDHVVRVNRTFKSMPQGKVGSLRDRPVLVAVSAGAIYSGASARQPDFLTPYLTAALQTIGLRDITFFSVQGTAFGREALHQARKAAEAEVVDHFLASMTGEAGPVDTTHNQSKVST
ncbi:FMN-dependent NADH-azoreductase [Variovorax boronicumulans]|uniref:FMN-dependent NADH-azoreductase n=1 Tax=Variovorax boronicumulans TaxID=436515 RepID=UPI0027831991|nr:NAD(P)H-dependent oxidoreductase [Variovorax boronicumulans]MDP9912460.1 FMN-dependent NADH-azoreductase [Variovorax boronicumulans]